MKPLTKAAARGLVQDYLLQLQSGRSYELAVVDEHTREEDFGWVFFYNTKQFLETGDVQWSLGGNAPLIVDRHEKLHVTGTAYPVEHYIEEFRKSLR